MRSWLVNIDWLKPALSLRVTLAILALLALFSACSRSLPEPVPTRKTTPTQTASPIPSATSTSQPPPVSSAPTGVPTLPTETDIPGIAPAEYDIYQVIEWTQDAHNPSRTGYTPEEPIQPWTLVWTWNGPDERGGIGQHFYDAPRESRSVTGGSFVYVPAGDHGLFALAKEDGQPAWNLSSAAFNAAPAYDPSKGKLYAGSADGVLYKIDAETGEVAGEYDAGSPLNKAVMLVNGSVYAVTLSGDLLKIKAEEMTLAWLYSSGSEAATPPAFSTSRGLIIFCTADLSVHAVDDSDGTPRWISQPSPHPPDPPYTFDGYWPVVADYSGVVFVRLNLGMGALWSGPGKNNIYPDTNAEIKDFLEQNPNLQNLYALDLDDGQPKFIPAVGFGGVETISDNGKDLESGPAPVIRRLPDGKEVAYTFFRSGQSDPPDGRWDSHLGEMVLDSDTIPGLEAGDLRFIRFDNSYVHITDEQCPLTMAGDSLFHAHWGASEGVRLGNRAPDTGFSYRDPIASEPHPAIIRRIQKCNDFDPETHWTSCSLILYSDGRKWEGPGWWVYWDVLDPPTIDRGAYSEGILPRYTYVSDGLVIVSGNGGELSVFRHSGR